MSSLEERVAMLQKINEHIRADNVMVGDVDLAELVALIEQRDAAVAWKRRLLELFELWVESQGQNTMGQVYDYLDEAVRADMLGAKAVGDE